MAAPINFSVNYVDTSGGGIGPYTVSVLRNPTAASGGTDMSSQIPDSGTNPQGTLNPQELSAYAAHVIGDYVATQNQSDPLN